MALQTSSAPSTPSAEVVGNAFVEQYYHILHNSPEMVYRFYQDSSVLSRPDSSGVMTSVTTMQGINEKILSLQYKDYKAEIKTADAQKSYMEGVTVLVTGCLTGKDNLKRKFAQSFFLAPQDRGYFVLNDVFRYVEDGESVENNSINGTSDAPAVPLTNDAEPTYVPDPPAPDPVTSVEEDQVVIEKAYDPSDDERQSFSDAQPQFPSNGNDISAAVESSSSAQEDAPKKSYASIVKVTKGSTGTTKVYVPTNTLKAASKKVENESDGSGAPSSVPEASAEGTTDNPENGNAHEQVEGYSIYVRNLPLTATASQLEFEFKKFGPIKEGGIQVRNHRAGYCYGFVEFLSSNSMNSAIQASPITIGGRQAVVEIKKTNTQVGSGRDGRGRFPFRGGYRGDIFRGRGGYGGGRGFGRNDYGLRGDFLSRGRGPPGRVGEGYLQGRGRGGRSGGPRQNAISA